MANTLLITKQTGNFFSIQLNSETPIISEQNRLTTVGSFCHFKTVSGANIIKEQDILYSDITLIASGTFTFASVNALWVKLVDVGFFNGLGASGGGGGGADQFTELIDTFNSYIGRDGHALVVNESELKIESVPFANVSKFIDLTDTPKPLLPNKMIVTNSAGNALIMTDLPATPETYLNAVGTFHYADLATQTVPLTIVSNVPKKLENDGLGTYTVLSNAPFGVSSVWNSTTDQLDFSEMSIGDLITLRVDASITTSSANQIVKCYTKLGVGSASVFDLIIAQEQVKTAGVYPFVAEVSFDLAYSDIVNNPAEIYVLSDGNSTITINGWYIEILRKNINISTIEVTGNTNLTTLQTASNVKVQSDTGADAIIPLGNGTLAGVSLNDYTNADKALVSGITGKEDVSNKQNSLATDATNTKYPTVTAVNSGLGGKLNTPTGLTTNFLPKWNGSGFGNSIVSEVGSEVQVNGTITASPAVNSNQVVVKSQLDAFVPSGTVNLTGNQTIAGVKTFSSPVVVPNGVGATDAVNKSQLDLKAGLASPTFTGTPTAPTATAGTNTTQVATTAFVASGIATADAGNVKLTGNQTIAGVKTFSSPVVVPNGVGATDAVNKSQLDLKAGLASPTFTGTPTAPTATAGTNTTQVATTAFVLANSTIIPQLESNATDLTVWNNGKGNFLGNTTFGEGALKSKTVNAFDVGFGRDALGSNTTGLNNVAIGSGAMSLNITGNRNSVLGDQALSYPTSGNDNTVVGRFSGNSIGSGSNLTSITKSVLIGFNIRPLNDAGTNEIVIGSDAIGAGSNTATLGNTNITSTILRGTVSGGSFVKNLAPTTNLLLAGGGDIAQSTFFAAPTGLTTNFLPKWNGSLTNSQIFDNGVGVGIGTNSIIIKLNVRDDQNTFSGHFSGNGQLNGISLGTDSNNNAILQGYKRDFSAINNILINPFGGRTLFNSTTDNGVDQVQVNGTISASPAVNSNQVVVKSQLDALAVGIGASGTWGINVTGRANKLYAFDSGNDVFWGWDGKLTMMINSTSFGRAIPMDITGNATSATSAIVSDSTNLLNGLGNSVWNASTQATSYPLGVQASFVQGSDGFPSNGSVLNVNTYANGGMFQLYGAYGSAFGGNQLWFRNSDYTAGGAWAGWKVLLDSSNFSSYISGAYLPLTGGSVSGSIDVNGTISASPAVNSNQVVVKSQLDSFVPSGTVNLTGNQTIAGVKTFSSPVVVPNGVGATDAVNKSQLDALASSGSYNASISNASNISGITIGRANYMKIGNVVSVNFSGSATFITTNASVTFEISLPFNKTLTNNGLRAGSAVPVSSGVISTGIIEHITSVSTFRVSINSSPLNGFGTISGSFMYNITD